MNCRITVIAFVALTLAFGVPAQEAVKKPLTSKKVIEWGWDEPDTKFIRENIDKMERFPFDGLVFHVTGNKGGNFAWDLWGGRKFTVEEFRPAIDDLKATKFNRFTELFLRVNVTPGKTDWFDDSAWADIRANFAVAAQIAREGRCKGFMFDVEQYDAQLFDYGKLKERAKKSFKEYQAQVRERGRQWMRAVNQHYPDITVILTFGYSTAQPEKGTDRSTAEYGLMADFIDGMLDACAKETTIVDGYEPSYPYKERAQFERGYETIKKKGLEWTSSPDKFHTNQRAGFGIWMDYSGRKKAWDTADFSKNHFRPEEFEKAVRTALELSDRYVWIYSEQPRWWTNEKLPQAYVDALRRAQNNSK